MINAVINNVRRRNLKDTDIGINDVEKCFDKLWAKECMNDLYENGFNNDKLPLLVKENINAMVAVKTKTGTTKQISISDVIMQGTVWGSLCCTSTIDNLGKLAYGRPDILYKYKGVPVPPLGMVDDILTVSNVKDNSTMNNLINTFIEHKKLKLSHEKCVRIHVGKGHLNCPEMKVHDSKMKEAKKEKYLGDIVDETGTLNATIEKRVSKGEGIKTEIVSIIKEIP